jgi:hypothetical protein
MKQITVALSTIIFIAIVLLIQEFYVPQRYVKYEYSSTDFIEPDESFVTCDTDDDCFKFKGSLCPADSGGTEVCINKDYVQEYNSVIDGLAGKHIENVCPEIYLVTDRECKCVDNICSLV